MPCEEFEDRLLEYQSLEEASRVAVEAHAAACGECRAFLGALRRVDQELSLAFSDVDVPAGFAARVAGRARAPKPSAIPELLDGIGWLGVFALAGCVGYFVAGFSGVWPVAISLLTAVAAWVSIRSYSELKS